MLRAIRDFFKTEIEVSEEANEEDRGERLQIAACALLLELAHADQEFSDSERAHIQLAIERQFALDPETAHELIELAERERRQSVDFYQFTSLIASSYDQVQKMVLAEIMWGLVFADGELANHESYLMRKFSQLLDLKPGFLAEARKRVESRGTE